MQQIYRVTQCLSFHLMDEAKLALIYDVFHTQKTKHRQQLRTLQGMTAASGNLFSKYIQVVMQSDKNNGATNSSSV